jgi:hypothetical protein
MGSYKMYNNVKNLLQLELYCPWYNTSFVEIWNKIEFEIDTLIENIKKQ